MSQTWIVNSIAGAEALGMIPHFLSLSDTRPAREQFHEAYAHGGGWRPFEGFALRRVDSDPSTWRLAYPGDPPIHALGYTHFRRETIVVFDAAWVAIVQQNGEFEIARMD